MNNKEIEELKEKWFKLGVQTGYYGTEDSCSYGLLTDEDLQKFWDKREEYFECIKIHKQHQ